jgi:nitrile hydratase accessory protein
LSAPDGAAVALASIPRADSPVFPTPWAARAFALAVALNERGVFTWSEWAEYLGAALRRTPHAVDAGPEAYWRAWLAALEEILLHKRVAAAADLAALNEAWRRAAEATPHGKPIELPE